jgi:hypothetical protein
MYTAFGGDFAEARRLFALGRTILRDLGHPIEYWAHAQGAGRIELLAGDLDAAARELREGCEHLIELGETAFLSTTAAILARVELRRGNESEARHWVEVAGRTASSGDRASQIAITIVKGQLLLAEGDPAGERHLRDAIRQADETDALIWRAEIRLDIARSLPDHRRDDAATLAREALGLAETKQIPVLIEEARQFLAELGKGVGD